MDQLAVCLLIFAVTVIGYCSGLYSIATISQISLIALTLTGCLSAKQALGYYSNSNVIMIAGMCVVAAGFNRTALSLGLWPPCSLLLRKAWESVPVRSFFPWAWPLSALAVPCPLVQVRP